MMQNSKCSVWSPRSAAALPARRPGTVAAAASSSYAKTSPGQSIDKSTGQIDSSLQGLSSEFRHRDSELEDVLGVGSGARSNAQGPAKPASGEASFQVAFERLLHPQVEQRRDAVRSVSAIASTKAISSFEAGKAVETLLSILNQQLLPNADFPLVGAALGALVSHSPTAVVTIANEIPAVTDEVARVVLARAALMDGAKGLHALLAVAEAELVRECEAADPEGEDDPAFPYMLTSTFILSFLANVPALVDHVVVPMLGLPAPKQNEVSLQESMLGLTHTDRGRVLGSPAALPAAPLIPPHAYPYLIALGPKLPLRCLALLIKTLKSESACDSDRLMAAMAVRATGELGERILSRLATVPRKKRLVKPSGDTRLKSIGSRDPRTRRSSCIALGCSSTELSEFPARVVVAPPMQGRDSDALVGLPCGCHGLRVLHTLLSNDLLGEIPSLKSDGARSVAVSPGRDVILVDAPTFIYNTRNALPVLARGYCLARHQLEEYFAQAPIFSDMPMNNIPSDDEDLNAFRGGGREKQPRTVPSEEEEALAVSLLDAEKDVQIAALQSVSRLASVGDFSSDPALYSLTPRDCAGALVAKSLFKLFHCRDADIRALAVSTASEAVDSFVARPAAVRRLIELLEDPAWRVRVSACRALGKIGERSVKHSSVPVLIDLFLHGKLPRREVADALARMGPGGVSALSVLAVGEKMEPFIRTCVPENARVIATEGLGQVPLQSPAFSEAVRVLTKLAADTTSAVVQAAAVRVLGNARAAVNRLYEEKDGAAEPNPIGTLYLTNSRLQPLFRTLADSAAEPVRSEAVRGMASLGPSGEGELAKTLLRSKSSSARRVAVAELRQFGANPLTPIVAALTDRNPDVREEAAASLLTIPSRDMRSRISQLNPSAQKRLRESARMGASYVQETEKNGGPVTERIGEIVSFLDEHT